eukprot:m.62893 g.62893  ORF g.62893 m.62893 type:complete len:532 (-) comp15818_c0_seq2:223-1818(-)
MTSLAPSKRHRKASKRTAQPGLLECESPANQNNEFFSLTESVFLDLGFAQILLTWFWWWFGELVEIIQNDAHPLAEVFAWFFSFSITTFSVLPVAICLIECGLGLRVVPESVSSVAAIWLMWNSFLIIYGLFQAALFFLAPLCNSAPMSHWDHMTQYLVFTTTIASWVTLGSGIGKTVCLKMKYKWGRTQEWGLCILWLCTPFLAVALQKRYSSPAGINSLVALTVIFLAYVFSTYLGQPEITGRREGLDLRTDPRWRALWHRMMAYFSLRVIFDKRATDPANPCAAIDVIKKATSKSGGTGCLIGFHPHGIIPYSAGIMSLSDDWNDAVSDGVSGTVDVPHFLVDSFIHALPLLRDITQWLGCREVSRESLHNLLQQGQCSIVVPGGQVEMLNSRSWDQTVTICTGHRGFIRMALEHNTPLIPALCIGEWSLMDNVYCPRIQRVTKRLLGFPIPFVFYGKSVCLPRQRALTIVIGEPITAASVAGNATGTLKGEALVEQVHDTYFASLKDLFERHKAACGYGDHQMIFED